MDKQILKETLLSQSTSFEADVRHKLDILTNEDDFLKDGENLLDQSDILLEAFQMANKEQNLHACLHGSSANPQPILKISARQTIKNNSTVGNSRHSITDKIAALRGCLLPGDYLTDTKK